LLNLRKIGFVRLNDTQGQTVGSIMIAIGQILVDKNEAK
jgi:hypothetical protein